MLGKILRAICRLSSRLMTHFLKTMQEHYPDDMALLSRTSIIDEVQWSPRADGPAGGSGQSIQG